MIVFVSNYYNHHQAPFSEAMYRLTGGNYRFIATKEIGEERLKLGYERCAASFVMQYSECPDECQKYIDEADVVIFGSAPHSLFKNRLKSRKLTFAYSERIYKRESTTWKVPFRAIKYYFAFGRYKSLFLLCAGAYAASDYAKTGTFIGRTYKWGYFPEVKRFEDIEKHMREKRPASLLWAARMIDWKHPELPVLVAKRLKDDGYSFTLDIIGNGNMEETVRQMIVDNNLSDCVHVLGGMKPAQVREHMEKSQIFLFTSDRNEGWGAVLNESMNSGCAVIANRAIGSVPYLLRHGENGLIYETEEELYNYTKLLLDDSEKAKELGKEAYQAMIDLWNADVAAERLLMLIGSLTAGDQADLFADGPCSYDDGICSMKERKSHT